MTRYTLRDIADQFQRWVTERAEKRNIPIVEAPKGRRDDFVDPRFRSVSIADVFPDGYRRWLGNNLTGDDAINPTLAALAANGGTSEKNA